MNYDFLNKLNKEIESHFPLLTPISTITTDGAVNRFDSSKQGDKAIWVFVNEFDYKGNYFNKATFGSWRDGNQYTISDYDDSFSKNKEFRQVEKEKVKENQEKIERVKQEKYKECREKWSPIFYSLDQNKPTHEYLLKKQLTENYHARVDFNGVLMVPCWNSQGNITGLQRIYLNPETNQFTKRYTYGIEKMGSFCPFGDIRKAKFIYICEGFATGASIYEAFKDDPEIAVASVFDTSNLLKGAMAIREINPNSFLVFAADHDVSSNPREHNIGEKKSRYASMRLSNSIVRKVKFDTGSNTSWSDYNDLHQFEGLEQVIEQLQVDETNFIEIIPLGYADDKCYYFSTSRKQILEFSKSDHNANHFMLHAPQKYWGDRFGYLYKPDGERTNNPDWKKVIENLGSMISKCGVFDHKRVRGIGVWREENDVVINLGDRLYFNGEFFPLHNNGLKSEYFYQSGPAVKLNLDRPLGNSDAIKFVEAFQMLNYKNKSDYIIILGWIYAAQTFAALRWRPHIWITGERGSGKSTILEYIDRCIMLSIMIQDSTAPGIRQRILNNAIPIISDESEPNTEKDRLKMDEVITLARQCSTMGAYEVLRGSASGKAISYNTNTTFCMGSIQLSSMGGADVSRFFVLEMNDNRDSDPEEFIKLENSMAELTELSNGLLVRAVTNFKQFQKNIEICKMTIKKNKFEARQADQLAPIVAGYYAYFDTGEIPESFIMSTIKEMNFGESDYVEDNKENDSDKCLSDIYSIQIPGKTMNIGQVFEKYHNESISFNIHEYDQMLGLFGIKFFRGSENSEIFLPLNSVKIKGELQRSGSFSDYKKVLMRHGNFRKKKSAWVAGRTVKGFSLDYSNS